MLLDLGNRHEQSLMDFHWHFKQVGASLTAIRVEAVERVRGFYLCMQGAVIREGLSTANILAVILWSRNIEHQVLS